ncbi:MAG: T9SS type A sorting domain-containing protein [Muribaculaceae bacterium]|nr:T9SS type A sorting domain-containing protein [Muribaculaceae bacterium]
MRTITLIFAGTLLSAASAATPYISKVYEYRPAPGQFINTLPAYEQGDTYESILSKVSQQLVGDRAPGLISLGAFGGYVVFGFDHSVLNKPGESDFKIYGNAMITNAANHAGSAEPGIVMVSRDDNGNGLPDDEWYELAGSDYTKESTLKGYSITYYAPAADHVAEPDPENKYINDRTYIRWTADMGDTNEGYVMQNTNHKQSYWPEWIEETTLSFVGTKLADNYLDKSGKGTYYEQYYLDWGYADNLPNAQDAGFNIDWAVAGDGTPVKLDKIDFVRVHTAVNQYCGWLGETSTEIAGAEDIHPDYLSVNAINADSEILLLTGQSHDNLTVRSSRNTHYSIYGMAGNLQLAGMLTAGETTIDIALLPAGIYILHTGNKHIKFTR